MKLSRSHAILLLFLSAFFCQGEQLSSDTLQKLLNLRRDDTNKVNILCKLGRESEGNALFDYANSALSLSKKLNFKRGIASSKALLAKFYYFKEDFSTSLEYCTDALAIAEEIKDYSLAAYICRYIGYNHFLNHPKYSLDYYNKSLEYSILANDKIQQSYAFSAMGNLYESWQDAKKALDYYQKSLMIREKSGTPDEIVSSLIETARALDRLREYDKSAELVKKALSIAETKGNNPQNRILLYQMIGYDLADRQQDYNRALGYFLKSYELVKKQGNYNKNNISSLIPVAEMFYKLGDYQRSSEYYKTYLELLQQNQKKLDKELFESQFSLKQEMEKQALLLRDSQILKQKVETEKEINIRNLFIGSFILLAICAFFIYRSYRVNQRINIRLENMVKEKTKELQLSRRRLLETNAELEAFIYRASHDLKGPLISSKSLVNLALQDDLAKSGEQYLSMIGISLNKLESILIGLQEVALIRQGSIKIVKTDIEETIKRQIETFRGYEKFDRILFNVDNKLKRDFHADEQLLKTILRNILENSIKYSRNNISTPFVNISLTEQGDFNLIQVTDNGIGIPPEFHSRIFDVFFRATEASKGTGLGLYIVKNAIDKLSGRVEVADNSQTDGITFSLYFPYQVSYADELAE